MSTGSQRKNKLWDGRCGVSMACHSPRDHWHVCVCLLAQNSHVSLFISPQSAPPIRGGRGGTGAKLLLDVLFYFSSFGSMDDCNACWWVWTWVALAVRLVPFRAWHQNPPSSQCIHLSSLISLMSYWESVLVWNSVTQSGYTGLGLGHRTVILHCVPRLGALCSPLDNLINCILLYAAKDEPHQSRCSVSCQFQDDLSDWG